MRKPTAKRLQNAEARAVGLSWNCLGNMDPTLTKPKPTPATTPKTTAFMQELAIFQVGEG
jgi:hypothetical protein